MRRFQPLVRLNHAAVGKEAVIFIRIASPRQVGRCAAASARLGELVCAIEISSEQTHGTLQYLVGLLRHCHEKFPVEAGFLFRRHCRQQRAHIDNRPSEHGIRQSHAHLFLVLLREIVIFSQRIGAFLVGRLQFILKLCELPVGGLEFLAFVFK